jgi:hypothetical protein
MDAETHNIPPGEYIYKVFSSGGRVIGMQKPAHHKEYCSNSCGGCIQCLVSSVFVANLIACRLNVFMSAVAIDQQMYIAFVWSYVSGFHSQEVWIGSAIC